MNWKLSLSCCLDLSDCCRLLLKQSSRCMAPLEQTDHRSAQRWAEFFSPSFFFIFNCAPQTTSFSLKRTPLSTGLSLKGGTIYTELCLFVCLFVFRKRLIRFLFWKVENVQWRSVELKMVSVRSEKPICAPPFSQNIHQMLLLKQFQCSSD